MLALYVLLVIIWFGTTLVVAMNIIIDEPQWQSGWPWQRKVALLVFWPLGLPKWIAMMVKEIPKIMVFMGRVQDGDG
jgi:hypothetical protein